jgi:hypothetical protein
MLQTKNYVDDIIVGYNQYALKINENNELDTESLVGAHNELILPGNYAITFKHIGSLKVGLNHDNPAGQKMVVKFRDENLATENWVQTQTQTCAKQIVAKSTLRWETEVTDGSGNKSTATENTDCTVVKTGKMVYIRAKAPITNGATSHRWTASLPYAADTLNQIMIGDSYATGQTFGAGVSNVKIPHNNNTILQCSVMGPAAPGFTISYIAEG